MFFMFLSTHRNSHFAPYILFLFALLMAQAAQLSGWFSRISDTMIGLIPFRVWLSDLLHRGEFPLWYPYVNPGFSLATLQFSSNFTNPLGLLLSSLFVYDTITYNIEELLTCIIGYTGQFLLAVSYRSTGWFAGPVAISYVLSSPVLQSRHAGICLPAFMYFPWILFSFRALVRSKIVLNKLAFVFSASLFSFLLIISSYPGLYFYAVFFALIYFLIELSFCDRQNVFLNLLISSIGLLFFIGLMSPYIYANIHFQTPAIFEGLPRNTIDANDYALHWYDISSLFFPNDIFEPNSYLFLNESNRLYFGLFPAVFFFGYIKNIIFQKISFRYIYLIRILSIYLAIIFVYYSQITPTVYTNKYDIAFIQTLSAFVIGIIFFPRLRSAITINHRLFLIFFITIFFTIDNVFIHHVREQVFPFSQIRHTYYVSGFCLCFFSLLGYDLLSQSLEANLIPQTIRFTKELLVFVLLYSLFIMTIQYYNSQMIIPDQYEPSFSLTTQIHIPRFLMWLLTIFTFVLLYLSTVWHKISPTVFISIFILNTCAVFYLSFSFFDYQWFHVQANIFLLFTFTIIHVIIFILFFLHVINNISFIQYNSFIIFIFVMDSIGGSFLIGINRDSFDNRLDAGRGIRAFQSSVATSVTHADQIRSRAELEPQISMLHNNLSPFSWNHEFSYLQNKYDKSYHCSNHMILVDKESILERFIDVKIPIDDVEQNMLDECTFMYNEINNIIINNSRVSSHFTATEDTLLIFPRGVDSDWTVLLDNHVISNLQKYRKYLVVPISKGFHNIEFLYNTGFLLYFVVMSLFLSVTIIIFLCWAFMSAHPLND